MKVSLDETAGANRDGTKLLVDKADFEAFLAPSGKYFIPMPLL
jgi:hypothetical protein